MSTGALVGLVLTESAPLVGVEPFIMRLIAGMEQALDPAGGSVLLLVVPDQEAELDTYRRWSAGGPVGCAVVANLAHDDPRPAVLAELGLPAVLAGRYTGPAALTSVVTDDFGAMTAAVEMLAGLGHRVLGRVTGPAAMLHTTDRTDAMREAAARLGLKVAMTEADYSAESGVRGARELLAARRRPTAVIFDNDVMAVAAQEDLIRSGVRVPADVSILATDDSALCELAVPSLSVMSIDVHEHGVMLGRAVAGVLDGAAPSAVAGPPIRILHRDSTGPARTTAARRA